MHPSIYFFFSATIYIPQLLCIAHNGDNNQPWTSSLCHPLMYLVFAAAAFFGSPADDTASQISHRSGSTMLVVAAIHVVTALWSSPTLLPDEVVSALLGYGYHMGVAGYCLYSAGFFWGQQQLQHQQEKNQSRQEPLAWQNYQTTMANMSTVSHLQTAIWCFSVAVLQRSYKMYGAVVVCVVLGIANRNATYRQLGDYWWAEREASGLFGKEHA